MPSLRGLCRRAVCQSVAVPNLQPFRGLRYDTASVPLDQVIAPPYDVVSPRARAELASRHELNAIHVELPEDDPVSGTDRYEAAATRFATWIARHAVVADPRPSLYPCKMTTPDGSVTTGVVGALGITDDVLPHEQTMPKARSDRLELLRATRANTSPIWGLSLAAGLTETFTPAGPPAETARDDEGVLHELWVVDDPADLSRIAGAAAAAPIVIADGHHRFDTATAYRDEVRAGNGGRAGGHDAVMAFVVELAEEHLHVEAIHRLVDHVPQGADLLGALGRYFDAAPAGPPTPATIDAVDRAGSPGLVTPEGAWTLTVRPGAYEEAGTDLDAGLVDLALADLPAVSLSYTPEPAEVLDAVREGAAGAGIMLRPVTVAQIAAWAAARRRMPPKTTYFVPKPRTGMVYRTLDEPPG